MIGLAFVPLVERMRGRLERCHPPEVVKVTGVDGQATVVRVPSRALTYYTLNLAPILALWIGLQFVFAALLTIGQPELPYALAVYHTILTAAGVGSEVQATTPTAKGIMITQIIVSVGTLSIILQEVRAAAYTCPPLFPCPTCAMTMYM